MSALARYLARLLWGSMLWFMRRPWMKRLQRASRNLFPANKRDQAWRSMVRQNRWARKVGLPMLTVAVNLLLASLVLTTTYFVVLGMYESGTFTAPDSFHQENRLQSPR